MESNVPAAASDIAARRLPGALTGPARALPPVLPRPPAVVRLRAADGTGVDDDSQDRTRY
jgi:hypothetical protein